MTVHIQISPLEVEALAVKDQHLAVRLTDSELVSAACNADNSVRAIETAVLRKNGIEVAE